MPCKRALIGEMPIVKAVRSHCFKKIGVTLYNELREDEFRVLTSGMNFFARLNAKIDPPELLLRCSDARREQLQSTTGSVRVSKEMHWTDLKGWNWTDFVLDGSVDEVTLLEIIDESYQLACDWTLSHNERACLALLARNLAPAELFKELLPMYGLQRRKEQILGTAKQAFLLRTEPSEDSNLEVGKTKIGGLPDLDDGVPWPVYKDGKPLAFLAQINLSDAATSTALPKSGLLSFFSVFGWQEQDDADPKLPGVKYQNDWTKVIYNPSLGEKLRRTTPPREVNVFKATQASLVPMTCFPQHTKELALATLKWNSDVKDKYSSLIGTYDMAVMQQLGNPARNLLLGYADFEQEFVRQVAKDDLSLLFQLASDDNAGMCWGDGGYLYFWMRESDLANANFDTILTDHQGG